MTFSRRTLLFSISAGLATALIASPLLAGSYPDRPITLIVPFPPGGSTSVVARSVADEMSAALHQPVVVDNRGGAGGTLGTRVAAKAAPDGYTIVLSYTGTFAIAPSIYPDPGYDPRKDFAPIGFIGVSPSVLVVHPSVPAHSLKEFIQYTKSSPKLVELGSPGIGTVNHLAGELLANAAGIKFLHVPYKGNGPAITDLLGGHIPMMFIPVPVAFGHVKAGQLRALAVTSEKRSALLPDVPTVEEQGFPKFEVSLRYGLSAPAGTPPEIIAQLNKALNSALALEQVKKRLADDGVEMLSSTPEAYAADLDQDEKKWGPLVRKLDLKVQ